MLRVGSDFSGVGAFNQALIRLGVEYKEVFACDMDKYARETFIHNYGEPEYYPTNVYDREIPSESLDVYMTSPPCQAFSLAGKRLGKDDKRGILFFNSHEFIKVNKPRFFIFENVKGLLSDDSGKTFQEWCNMLGGKSVNGVPVLFPYEESVPYHLYWQVLNAKHHGVPQNRERVFLIGIRDDADNRFQFPREEHLTKRLKDVLEDEVDEKYFLSNDGIKNLLKNQEYNKFNPLDSSSHTTNVITSRVNKISNDNPFIKVGTWRTHNDGRGFREIEDGNCPTIPARAREDESGQPVVMQLNPSLESGGKQPYQQNRVYDSNGLCPALNAGQITWGGNLVLYNDKRLNETLQKHELPTGKPMMLDTYNQSIHENSICISTRINASSSTHLSIPNDMILDCYNNQIRKDGLCGTITQHCSRNGMTNGMKLIRDYKIRRLTPRECFRLMDFPDTFTWPVSDSQAYKQAGNSIVVNVLYKILKQLPL